MIGQRVALALHLHWRGELELPVAFWGGFVFIDWIVFDKIAITAVGLTGSSFMLRFATALVVLLNIFVLTGVWRSATYWTGGPLWATLAKCVCVAAACRVVLTFVNLMFPGMLPLS